MQTSLHRRIRCGWGAAGCLIGCCPNAYFRSGIIDSIILIPDSDLLWRRVWQYVCVGLSSVCVGLSSVCVGLSSVCVGVISVCVILSSDLEFRSKVVEIFTNHLISHTHLNFLDALNAVQPLRSAIGQSANEKLQTGKIRKRHKTTQT